VTSESEGFALLVLRDGDTSSRAATNPALASTLPRDLLDRVGVNRLSGAQQFEMQSPSSRFESLDGDPYIAVGVNLPSINAAYFEAFSLAGTQRTLRVIATSLFIASAVTTAGAAGLGLWNSRRLMRPLSRVADAAGELAAGSLDVRLEREDDPDLGRLADSFNAMADAVQTRIQREARFASDVSHELRSPITALSAAVDVLDARRSEFPGRTGQALDVVVTQVRRFDRMVLDLLELSRIDAGATELNLEPLQLDDTVRRIAQRYGYADVPIVVGPGARKPLALDKLRLERIMGNLLDNAKNHANGPERITIEQIADLVEITVEDAGPGVSDDEKERIFERFARGSTARHRVGTGLGLALVAEHAAALGGRAWVEDRPGGGSRFVVSFPGVSAR
jgi:signal transduction histidine kinase